MSDGLTPTRDLDIRNGQIHYTMYGQDDEPMEAVCADTEFNRKFVVWVRKFDRQSWSRNAPNNAPNTPIENV